jgi:CubicO group peptidase (beta-lactamase class C family)
VAQTPEAADAAILRSVDRAFMSFRGTDVPGCAVGVSRDGKVVLERAYGMANLETGTPITPASIFHVASISKQFTAMAIVLLAGDGKLSLDDDVRQFIPELPDYGTTITLRNLLTHTSGLRDQWDLLSMARGRFEENRITTEDVMEIVPRQKALNFAPGTEFLYSNTGFTLLAVVVQRVSGKSLREFAAERIFAPLGMTSTHFHDDYTMLVPGRTSAYRSIPGGWRVSIPNFDTYGATSLFTTVGDLLRWEANFDAPVVGTSAQFDEMQAFAQLTNGDTVTYGLGVFNARYRGAREIGHGGADAGYRSYVSRFPDLGLAVAIACNASTASTTSYAHAIADAYLGAQLASSVNINPPAAAAPSAAELQSRVGIYVQPVSRQITEVSLRNGRLALGRTSGPLLIPVAENRFRVTGQSVEIAFVDGPTPRFERTIFGEARFGGGYAQVRREPEVFKLQSAPPATTAQLGRYAGEYYSEELDARYRITAGDSTLMIKIGTESPTAARPLFGDTFVRNGLVFDFVRSGARVTGFRLTNGRTRGVGFVRVDGGR